MEERVRELRHMIVSTIKGPLVLQYMIPAVISQGDGIRLKQLYNVSMERANHQLLDLLYTSTEPGKWRAFLDALQQAEYSYLWGLLQSTDRMAVNTCAILIDLFADNLKDINPAELLAALRYNNIISEHDREEIVAKQTSQGSVAGAMLLIERIQTHLEPQEWFSRFLQVLHDNNKNELVHLVDPTFYDEQMGVDKEDILYSRLVKDNTNQCHTAQFTKHRINEFRRDILELLRVSKLIDTLVPTVVSREQASTLLQMEYNDPIASTHKLLDIVIQGSDSVQTAFVHSLQRAGYSFLAKLVSDPNYENQCQYLRKVIPIFEPTIQSHIEPVDVVSLLVSEGLLGTPDKSEIMSKRETHGKMAAAMMMLDRIPCRLEPHIWYTKLLQILVNTDHSEVVKLLEPDYLNDPDKFTRKLCNFARSHPENSTNKPSDVQDVIVDISSAINSFQEQEQRFLNSADVVRNQIKSEKRRKHKELEDMVEREQQNMQKKARRLQEIRDELNTPSTETLKVPYESEKLINESKQTVTIAFTPNRIIDNCHISRYVETTAAPVLLNSESLISTSVPSHTYNVARILAKRKRIFEDKSSSSSYLLVSDKVCSPSSSDQYTSDYGDKEREEELLYFKKCMFFENDEYVFGRKYQNAFIDILQSNISPGSLSACSDIAMSGVDGQLIGLSTATSSVCIFDSSYKLIDKIQFEKGYSRLAQLSESEFIVVSFNDPAVHVIDMSKRTVTDTRCTCASIKLAVCANEGKVYVLCSEKHMHIYSSGKWTDVKLQGIDMIHSWMPNYCCINSNKKTLFISNMDMNDIYCFDTETGTLVYDQTINSNNYSIVCAIFCIDDHVFIMDKFNKCLLIHTAEDWLYRDSIEHEAFSSCKLVTVGASSDILTVVCTGVSDQIVGNNEEIPVPFEDVEVLSRPGASPVAISASHGASIGIVTNLGVMGVLPDSFGRDHDNESISEDSNESGPHSQTTYTQNSISTNQHMSATGFAQNRGDDIHSTAGTITLENTSNADIVHLIKIKLVLDKPN